MNPAAAALVRAVRYVGLGRRTMADFKRVLFPVDFSEQSSLAAPQVAAFAKHFDAELLLLHVLTVPGEISNWEPPGGG